jgi:hypothetical protein
MNIEITTQEPPKPTYDECKHCGECKPEVDPQMFNGLCGDCTTLSLYDETI